MSLAYKVETVDGDKRWVRSEGWTEQRLLEHPLIVRLIECRELDTFGSGKRFVRPPEKLTLNRKEGRYA